MRKRGFTLIELLVVIAIIGILATIILVAIANARPKALRSSALESLNRVISTANLCRDADEASHLLSLTATDYPTSDVCDGGGSAQAKWPGQLKGYERYQARQESNRGITILRGDGTTANFGNIDVSESSPASDNITVNSSDGYATGVK